MELAERVGKESFYKYFEAYGFTEKTGIDLAGEVSSIYPTNIDEFNQTELAVYSFGQTFKIPPMQQICGVSAVANGGDLLKPHVDVYKRQGAWRVFRKSLSHNRR